MPFENFFDETDKHDFRFGVIVVAVGVLLVLAVFSYNYLTGLANDAYKAPPVSTDDSQRFVNASDACDQLAKPEQFERVKSESPQFTDSSAQVFYNYRSERDFDEVLPTFLVWFEANGWGKFRDYDSPPSQNSLQPIRQLIFRKEKYTINILYHYPKPGADAPNANYEIKCRYGEISFDIYD